MMGRKKPPGSKKPGPTVRMTDTEWEVMDGDGMPIMGGWGVSQMGSHVSDLAIMDVDTDEVLLHITAGARVNVYEEALWWIMDTRAETNVLVEPIESSLAAGMPVPEGYDDVLWVRVDRRYAFEPDDDERSPPS